MKMLPLAFAVLAIVPSVYASEPAADAAKTGLFHWTPPARYQQAEPVRAEPRSRLEVEEASSGITTYLASDPRDLIVPEPCKYMPGVTRGNVRPDRAGVFYVETAQYSDEQHALVKRICEHGTRVIAAVADYPSADGSPVRTLIDSWVAHYRSENRFFVTLGDWIVIPEHRSYRVKRTLWLSDSDPDLQPVKLQRNPDPLMAMMELDPRDRFAQQVLHFEWEMSTAGDLVPVSDLAKKITRASKKSLGSFGSTSRR